MHRRILDLLPFYITGKLSAQDTELVRKHLAECQMCYQSYIEWQIISREVYQNVQDGSQSLPALHLPFRLKSAPKRRLSIPVALLTAVIVILLMGLITSKQLQPLRSPTITTSIGVTGTPSIIFPPPTSTIVILSTLEGSVLHDPPPDQCAAHSPSTDLVNIYDLPLPQSRVVAQLYPGEYLVVIKTNGSGWYNILGRNSKPVGWVWDHDVVISGPACIELPETSNISRTSSSRL
jgi:hypothetical protein